MSASHSNVGNVGNTSDVKKHAVAGFTAVHARGCAVCGAYGQWKHTEECPNRDVPVEVPTVPTATVPAAEIPKWSAISEVAGSESAESDGGAAKTPQTPKTKKKKEEPYVEPEIITAKSPFKAFKDRIRNLVLSTETERSGMNLPKASSRATGQAAELIWSHLLGRAQAFVADGMGQLLMKDDAGSPVPVAPDDPYFVNLLYGYGLFSGTDYFNVIGKFIGNRCAMEGVKATMAFNSRYNPSTKAVYFAESAGNLLRVSKDSITRVPNGSDGMLFKFSDSTQPLQVDLTKLPTVQYSLVAGGDSLLTSYLFDGLVFEESTMTPEQKRTLLTAYVTLLILAGVIGKERALLQMLGESGSGKTFFLKKLGRIIVGDSFDVQPMQTDIKEFENVLVNNDFVAYDNVKNVKDDIRGLICQAVTGCSIERRELFTTMGRVKMPSKASLAVSAITPVLGESEQANRSITIKLGVRGASNREESGMLANLDAKRNDLIGELLVRTQMILKALHAERGYVPAVRNRLAGVATFILRVAKHEGWFNDAEKLLAAWNDDQLDAALDDDNISTVLFMWMTEPDWKPASFSAEQLHTKLGEIAIKYGCGDLKNPRSLSVSLRRSVAAYSNRFGMKVVHNAHTKRSTFTFEPSEIVLSALRGSRTTSDPVCSEVGL